jgi:hypothetical protein
MVRINHRGSNLLFTHNFGVVKNWRVTEILIVVVFESRRNRTKFLPRMFSSPFTHLHHDFVKFLPWNVLEEKFEKGRMDDNLIMIFLKFSSRHQHTTQLSLERTTYLEFKILGNGIRGIKGMFHSTPDTRFS